MNDCVISEYAFIELILFSGVGITSEHVESREYDQSDSELFADLLLFVRRRSNDSTADQ